MEDMNYNDRGPVRVLSKGVVSYVGTGGALGTINVCSPPPKLTFPSSKGIPPTLTLTISSMKARVSTPAVYVSGGRVERSVRISVTRKEGRKERRK